MSARRRLAAVVAGVVLLVVVLTGLAVLTVSVLPAALALGAAVFALVAGAGSRVLRVPGRRRAAPVPPEAHPDDDASSDADTFPRWTTRWELGVPVDAVPLVRDRLTALLQDWGLAGEAAEPTLLVVTELVSNAAEHGSGPAWLGIERRGGSVHVAVHDGAAQPPRRLPADPTRLRGRGLSLVDAVSSRWGWTDDPPGKVVWAEVPTAWPP
jgi:anti-sigma regulatory factor (Ser/Thr protein kinase)